MDRLGYGNAKIFERCRHGRSELSADVQALIAQLQQRVADLKFGMAVDAVLDAIERRLCNFDAHFFQSGADLRLGHIGLGD